MIFTIEELGSALLRRAEILGVEIRQGHAITGFQQTTDGMTVQSGNQSFQSHWLVGLRRKPLYRSRGGRFVSTELEFTGYSAQLEVADPEKLSPDPQPTPAGMYFQSQLGTRIGNCVARFVVTRSARIVDNLEWLIRSEKSASHLESYAEQPT